MGAGPPTAELAGVVAVDVFMVVMVMVTALHGWTGAAGAGAATAAGIDDETVSTASEADVGEP